MPGENEGGQGQAFTMEEMEQSIKADEANQSATKPDELKLEGDAIPEKYRGKTLNEILKENSLLEQRARLAETERTSLQTSLESVRTAPPPVQPVNDEKEMSRDELATLFNDDPLAAIDVMNQQAIRRAEKHLSVRLGQIEQGTIGAAEGWAREQYKEEFDVLGPQITQFVQSLPDKSMLTTNRGWKDVISYVRGQDDNFNKLMEHKASGGRTIKDGRAAAEQDSGFTGTGSARGQVPSGGGRLKSLSPELHQIAEGLGLTDAEYIKWANVGN